MYRNIALGAVLLLAPCSNDAPPAPEQSSSVSPVGAPIEKPQFTLEKKEFKVDQFKVNVRRPERS